MPHLRVIAAGALTTVQDLGRPGWASSGVSASGAADTVSLRIGNLLVGNEPGAAALEMTLVGGIYEAEGATVVAVTGSNFAPTMATRSGRARRIEAWRPIELKQGDTIRFDATRSGARCYLCVRGGIRVPPLLDSASTHLLTGLGGHQGRALRKGDLLDTGEAVGPLRSLRVPPDLLDRIVFRRILRVVPGPQADWFPPESVEQLHSALWEISEEADRVGLRLRGPSIHRAHREQLATEGVCLGAVQVPDGGQPIVLFVEHQTTGGYPKIANVITADLPAVGQLRPRDLARFEPTSLAEARDALAEQERFLAGALEPA
jgi:antagonist of KipI